MTEDIDPIEEIIPLFGYAHLPQHLRAVSQPFAELAAQIASTLPHNRELIKALDALLVSKDAAVRALVLRPVIHSLGQVCKETGVYASRCEHCGASPIGAEAR